MEENGVQPFHIVHCELCGGAGVLDSLVKDGHVFGCPACDGTGHRVLPFKFEVILEAERVVGSRPDGDESEGEDDGDLPQG